MTAQSDNWVVALDIKGVHARLGKVDVLHNLSLQLPRARWTSIIGPNGAGKSTLLKAVARLLPATGAIDLLGEPMATMSRRMQAQKMSWLGQNETSPSDLAARDVVMLGRLPHQAWLAGASGADHEAVERAMQQTQSWGWRDRSLGQLSGGERQRVLLARALAVEAQVLLMDEPLAHLDPPHQADWLALVRELVVSGKTVVSVLHEISMALHADEVVIVNQGRVVHQGPCSDAATHRAIEAVFEDRVRIRGVDNQWVALPSASGKGKARHGN